MTAMIDVVFQLLTFFVMSFKVLSLEGDFSIKMPLSRTSETPTPDEPDAVKLILRVTSNTAGEIAAVRLNQYALPPDNAWSALRTKLIELVNSSVPGETRASPELELDCDFNLKYTHVIAAIDASTGYPVGDGRIHKLVEKISFAPPRRREE